MDRPDTSIPVTSLNPVVDTDGTVGLITVDGTDDDPNKDLSLGDLASGGDLREVDYNIDESESKFEKTIRSLMRGLQFKVADSQ